MSLFDQQWHEGRVPYFLAGSSGSGGGGSFTPGAVAGDLLPTTDATYDVGSGALRWQDIFSTSLSTITATLSGNLTAANTALSGALTAASASLSGALTSASVSSGTGVFSGAVDVSGLLRALGGITITGGVTATSGTLSSLAVSGSTTLASASTSGNLAVGGTLSSTSPSFAGTTSTAAINNSGTVTSTNFTATGQVQTPAIQSTSSIQIGNDIYPSVNNLFSNGTNSNRWAALWAVAGDITTLAAGAITASTLATSGGVSVGGTLTSSTIGTGNITASGTIAGTGAVSSGTSLTAPVLYGSTGAQVNALASYSGGDIAVSSALVPSGTRNLGSSGSRWTTAYANTLDANLGSITTLTSSYATLTDLAVPGTVSTPNLYSGNPGADILVGSSLVSGVSKNLGSAPYPWIYGYITNLVSSNLATGPITATTLGATSATLSGALTAASAALSGALTAASASISGTLSVGTLSLASLNTGAITASSLTASGAVNSATAYTSGLAQHDGGMLGSVRAVGSFSETNTILHYEYNDLEDCTTIRTVRNSHVPRIELGYVGGGTVRMTAGSLLWNSIYRDPGNVPYCRYSLASSFSMVPGTPTDIVWDTNDEARNLAGAFVLDGSNPARIKNVSSTTLLFKVDYWIIWAFGSGITRTAKIKRVSDGASYALTMNKLASADTATMSGSASVLVPAGDSVTVEVNSDSGLSHDFVDLGNIAVSIF